MASLPPDLKAALPFLNRAEELDSREPLMAYYCRLCAVKTAMSAMNQGNKVQVYPHIEKMMGQLEEMKKEITSGGGSIPPDSTGKDYVSAFAYKIFLQADNEDRAGTASDKTAKKFLFSSTFYDVLKVFGDLDQEVIEKQKYAKWKASDIIKALKEGRKPVPGPPGGDPNLPPNMADAPPPTQQPPMVPKPHFNLPPSNQQPSAPTPKMNPAPPKPVPVAAPRKQHVVAPDSDDEDDGPLYDPEMISSVQKYCKFASSALDYEDIQTAIDNLEKSLALLRGAMRHR